MYRGKFTHLNWSYDLRWFSWSILKYHSSEVAVTSSEFTQMRVHEYDVPYFVLLRILLCTLKIFEVLVIQTRIFGIKIEDIFETTDIPQIFHRYSRSIPWSLLLPPISAARSLVFRRRSLWITTGLKHHPKTRSPLMSQRESQRGQQEKPGKLLYVE